MHYIVVCTYPITKYVHVRGFVNLPDALAWAESRRAANTEDHESLKAIGIEVENTRTVTVHEAFPLTTEPVVLFDDVDEANHKA